SGHFSSQKDIAKTLGISMAHVSRVMKFADLPAGVIGAFGDQTEIKESWAVALAQRCEDAAVRTRMLAVARSLSSRKDDELKPDMIFRALINCEEKRQRARSREPDVVVRSAAGDPLFRVSYRNNDVCIVIPRRFGTRERLGRIAEAIRNEIEVDFN